MEFVAKAIIDGDVALVDGDAEAAEDGSDSSAVVESAAVEIRTQRKSDGDLGVAGPDSGFSWRRL